MQFPLPDVTYILHNKNPLLNKFSPVQSSMGIPFRMVTLPDMIICELRLGEKQGEGERVFSFQGVGTGLCYKMRWETGGCPRNAPGFWMESPK